MARSSIAFPNEVTIAGGLRGLMEIIHPLFLASSEQVALEGLLPEISMIVPSGQFFRNVDEKTGQMGEIRFNMVEWFAKMTPHIMGTERIITRAGNFARLDVPVFAHQVTEEIDNWRLDPFAQEMVTDEQSLQMGTTVDFVMRGLDAVRVRDRPIPVLMKISNNTLKCYDNEFLASEDHAHLDGTLFSNLFIPGQPIKNQTVLPNFPTRANEDDVGIDELHEELVIMSMAMSEFRQSPVEFRQQNMNDRFWVLVRNPLMANAFNILSRIQVFKQPFVSAESEMLHEPNRFFGAFNVWKHDKPPLADDFGFDLIPAREGSVPLTTLGPPVLPFTSDSATGTGTVVQHSFGSSSVTGLQAEARPVIWAMVLEATGPEFKSDQWRNLSTLISVLEATGYAGGDPSQFARRDRVAP